MVPQRRRIFDSVYNVIGIGIVFVLVVGSLVQFSEAQNAEFESIVNEREQQLKDLAYQVAQLYGVGETSFIFLIF